MRQTITVNIKRPRAGCEIIWTVLANLEADVFSKADVMGALEKPSQKAEARKYMKRLLAGGYLKAEAEGFRLVRCPSKAPRFDKNGHEIITDRQQMWNAMRQLGWFTINDLAVAASITNRPIKQDSAKHYVSYLFQAEFLNRSGHRYRLKPKHNSGPYAPQVITTKVVFDQNSEKAVQIGPLS